MSYSVSLDKFEGPLDLLLHLIEKAELDIEDIFVSQITSQYLEYIKDINSIDMDRASEFLTVAAQLMLIKSRRLLPRPPVLDSNEEDPEQILIQQLKDYKLFKAAGQDLQQLYLQASKSLTRLPEDVALPPQRIEIENMDINNLYLAFARVLDRANQASPPDNSQSVRADSFTVRRQIIRVRDKLKSGTTLFWDIFEQDATKLEIVVTFMAILELLSHGEIKLSQRGAFSPIKITIKQLSSNDNNYIYMDEVEDEL